MRVVSFVPSWTETLLWAGVSVVGRTRFCLHPAALCCSIPVVGGTKDVNWKRVEALKPDLLVLDQEENTEEMAVRAPVRYLATHIRSVKDVSRELDRLSRFTANERLAQLAGRWRRIERLSPPSGAIEDFPGLLRWITRPATSCSRILYLIWQSPWITVSKDTFIGSVIEKLGFGDFLYCFHEKYPKITLESFKRKETLLLLASEPYPFLQRPQIARETGFPAAIVDGEKFSWFGIRSLWFLEQHLGLAPEGGKPC